MSDLFGSLTSAARALEAQRYGLDVVGQNMANVNTPGYARRVVDLRSVPGSAGSPGGGVDVVGVRALRDRMLEQRLVQEVPAEQRETAMARTLSGVEAALGQPGTSIDADLQQFFDAFASLAEAPTSSVTRNDVLVRGAGLATSFNRMAANLDEARLDADRQVRAAVDDINTVVSRIATLNRSISTAQTKEAVLPARDEQAQLVRRLSELADVHVVEQTGGEITVTLRDGQPLVVGETVSALGVTSTPPAGLAAITLRGASVTGTITGGTLGGLLAVRDVNIPAYQGRLDALAFGVAQQVNAVHQTGFDQTGAPGGVFFTAPGAVAGAAAAMAVAPAVAADARKIAAAGVAQEGDNTVARSVAGLAQARVLDGNTATFTDAWADLVYRVGRDTRTATENGASRGQIVRQVDALRDQVSGISLDEEATNMLKFQRAYEANARFFRAVDDALTMLMSTLAR